MSEQGERLIKAVRDAAARNPLHVFQGTCMYVRDGQPACLIGHGAWDLGLIDQAFENSCANDEGVDGLMNYLGMELDYREMIWLNTAQETQDCNGTWMDSIRTADEAVAEYDREEEDVE